MVAPPARPGTARPGPGHPRPVQERGLSRALPQSDRAPARSRRRRAGRRVGLGQVHVGRRPLPPRRGRLLRRRCAASSAAGRPTSTPRPTRSTLLEQIVAARTRPRADHRRRHPRPRRRAAGRLAGGGPGRRAARPWPSLLDTSGEVCRRRNARRDRPVPAASSPTSYARVAAVRDELAAEGWDHVEVVADQPTAPPARPPTASRAGRPSRGARARTGCGSCSSCPASRGARTPAPGCATSRWPPTRPASPGIALMDHLIQIPQVDRAWEPIPEPWVTLGAGRGPRHRLTLGTLCTPVTFRPAGVTAKAAATLDALSGGRAFLGLGAGWWEREHAAYGLPFPPAARAARPARDGHRDLPRAVGARHEGVRRRRASRCRRPRATRARRTTSRSSSAAAASGAPSRSPPAWPTPATCPSDPEVLRTSCTCSTGTWPPPAGPATTSRSPCSTCRSSGATATTRGPGSSGSAGGHRPPTSPGGPTPAPPTQHRERYARLADLGVSTVFVGAARARRSRRRARASPDLTR